MPDESLPTYTIVPAIDHGEQLKRIADSLEDISNTLDSIFNVLNDSTEQDDWGKRFRVSQS